MKNMTHGRCYFFTLPVKWSITVDILLIVGSSLQVYPAAGLYRYAPIDIPIYVIDPKPVPISDSRVTFIQDVATKGMEKFVGMLAD